MTTTRLSKVNLSGPTRAELDAAWPRIMAAPKDGAAVSHLCLRPDFGQRQFVDEITLTKDRGIPGERWQKQPWLRDDIGAPHPGIQVSILQKRVLDLVWPGGTDPVHPGDTCIADMDLSEQNVPAGTLLQLGSAVLQVSDVFNDGCTKWKVRYGQDAFEWVRDPRNKALRPRGVLCAIVQDGSFKTGDMLTKIDA